MQHPPHRVRTPDRASLSAASAACVPFKHRLQCLSASPAYPSVSPYLPLSQSFPQPWSSTLTVALKPDPQLQLWSLNPTLYRNPSPNPDSQWPLTRPSARRLTPNTHRCPLACMMESWSHTHTHVLTFMYSHAHSHTYSHLRTHTHIHVLTLTLTLTLKSQLTLTPTLTLILKTHTCTHSLTL